MCVYVCVCVCGCVCVCVCVMQVESLGGFKIVHKSEGEDDLVFRFLHESNLQGGTFITVSPSGYISTLLVLPTCVCCQPGTMTSLIYRY